MEISAIYNIEQSRCLDGIVKTRQTKLRKNEDKSMKKNKSAFECRKIIENKAQTTYIILGVGIL